MIVIISYKLHVTSDLHIGSGIGLPGVIDEYVVRDQDNFPFLPGSEIKGILRSNCVNLLKYTGKWESNVCEGQKQWHDKMEEMMSGIKLENFCALAEDEETCVLCSIFGSPAGKGNWWFSTATYPKPYRDAIRNAELENKELRLAFRDMATSAHTTIDKETKRTKENHLINLEVVRIEDNRYLKGSVEMINSNNIGNDQIGWLTASLLFTRRIGGKKRRGWGKCRFELVSPDKSNALTAMEKVIRSS
ncbi:hypothetical protein GF312_01920 [Candidatus Poribacteria bacterium]|nr:hypothetical protein [Candidatus Poribacteria bacterium]